MSAPTKKFLDPARDRPHNFRSRSGPVGGEAQAAAAPVASPAVPAVPASTSMPERHMQPPPVRTIDTLALWAEDLPPATRRELRRECAFIDTKRRPGRRRHIHVRGPFGDWVKLAQPLGLQKPSDAALRILDDMSRVCVVHPSALHVALDFPALDAAHAIELAQWFELRLVQKWRGPRHVVRVCESTAYWAARKWGSACACTRVTSYGHDSRGNLVWSVNAKGDPTRYTFDGVGRMTKKCAGAILAALFCACHGPPIMTRIQPRLGQSPAPTPGSLRGTDVLRTPPDLDREGRPESVVTEKMIDHIERAIRLRQEARRPPDDPCSRAVGRARQIGEEPRVGREERGSLPLPVMRLLELLQHEVGR